MGRYRVPESWLPRIEDAVLPDQRIVWCGRPAFFRVTVNAVGGSACFLVLVGGWLFLTIIVCSGTMPYREAVLAAVLVLIPGYIAFAVCGHGLWSYFRQVYAVTERRAVVLAWRGGRYVVQDELRPERLGRLKRVDKELGVGDLVFGYYPSPGQREGPGGRIGPYGFIGVRGVDEAEWMLRTTLTPLVRAEGEGDGAAGRAVRR